jgi:hypothetical protein
MTTGEKLPKWVNKKLIALDVMEEHLYDYLEAVGRTAHKRMYRDDGVYDSQATVTGSAIGEVSVPAAFQGTDGEGYDFDILALDPLLQDVSFENANGVNYHMGLKVVLADKDIEVNPVTGKPQYAWRREEYGNVAEPDLVTDNGTTLTFRVDTVCEGGAGPYSHAGRTVRVWMKTPKGVTTVDAIEEAVISWDGSNNTITTTGLLGQTAGLVDTATATYWVMEIGPRIVRATSEDLAAAIGVLFLADFDGNTSAPPVPDHTGQRILTASLVNIDELWDLTSFVFGGMALEGGEYLGESPATYAQISAAKIWVQGKGTGVAGRVVHPNTSVGPLAPSSILYLYHDGADHQYKTTATKATAYALGNLPMFVITTDGASSITDAKDIAFRLSEVQRQGVVTVGSGGVDAPHTNFTDLQAAIDWIARFMDQPEEFWPGVELWLVGTLDVGTKAVTIPIECKGLTIRGTNWLGKGGRGKLTYGDINTDLALIKVLADGVRFVGIHFTHGLTGTGTGSRLIENSGTPQGLQFEGCLFDSTNDNLAYAVYGGSGLCNNYVFKTCEFQLNNSTPTSVALFYQAGLLYYMEDCQIVGNPSKTQLEGGGYGADYSGAICLINCDINSLASMGINSSSSTIVPVVYMFCCRGGIGEVRNGAFVECVFTSNTFLNVGTLDVIDFRGGFLAGVNPIRQLAPQEIRIRDAVVQALSTSTYWVNGSKLHADNVEFLAAAALGGTVNAISLSVDGCSLINCKVTSSETSTTVSDMIRVTGDETKINGCELDGSRWRKAISIESEYNIVENCHITNPVGQATQKAGGIRTIVTANHNVISGNHFVSLGDVTNGGEGIRLASESNIISHNNFFTITGPGVYLVSGDADRNVINNNAFKSCGLAAGVQNAMQIDTDYNVIVGNLLYFSVGDAIEINGDYNIGSANLAYPYTDDIDDNGTRNDLVLGNVFAEGSADSETTTSSTTAQQKLRLTVANMPVGRYRVAWSYEWQQTGTISDSFLGRVQVDDTTTIAEQETEPQDISSSQWTPAAGIAYLNLTSGSHNFDIDYWVTSGGTAGIRRARLEVWRVK